MNKTKVKPARVMRSNLYAAYIAHGHHRNKAVRNTTTYPPKHDPKRHTEQGFTVKASCGCELYPASRRDVRHGKDFGPEAKVVHMTAQRPRVLSRFTDDDVAILQHHART